MSHVSYTWDWDKHAAGGTGEKMKKPIRIAEQLKREGASMWPYASPVSRRKKRAQPERAEQEALLQAVRLRPWHVAFWHLPAERLAGPRGAELLRKAGVRPGLPDNVLFLPCPKGEFSFAVSELKRPGAPPSAVSAEQRRTLDILADCGACVAVHHGWEQSIAFFDCYVDGRGEHGARWWER